MNRTSQIHRLFPFRLIGLIWVFYILYSAFTDQGSSAAPNPDDVNQLLEMTQDQVRLERIEQIDHDLSPKGQLTLERRLAQLNNQSTHLFDARAKDLEMERDYLRSPNYSPNHHARLRSLLENRHQVRLEAQSLSTEMRFHKLTDKGTPRAVAGKVKDLELKLTQLNQQISTIMSQKSKTVPEQKLNQDQKFDQNRMSPSTKRDRNPIPATLAINTGFSPNNGSDPDLESMTKKLTQDLGSQIENLNKLVANHSLVDPRIYSSINQVSKTGQQINSSYNFKTESLFNKLDQKLTQSDQAMNIILSDNPYVSDRKDSKQPIFGTIKETFKTWLNPSPKKEKNSVSAGSAR